MRGRHVLAALAVGVIVASPIVGLGALVGSDGSGAWGTAASIAFVGAAVAMLAALSARP